MEYDEITYELDDHVAVLTYDRPEQRNAVSRRMNTELHHAWRRFRGRTGTPTASPSTTRTGSAATRGAPMCSSR